MNEKGYGCAWGVPCRVAQWLARHGVYERGQTFAVQQASTSRIRRRCITGCWYFSWNKPIERRERRSCTYKCHLHRDTARTHAPAA